MAGTYSKWTSSGWRDYVNPKGDTYYVNDDARAVTHSDISNPFTLAVLAKACRQLKRQPNIQAWNGYNIDEIWLDVIPDTKSALQVVEYYFVDREKGELFWAEDVPSADLGLSEAGQSELSTLSLSS